ncbi:hypothetical protein [Brevundimonas sp. SGAir0440]|uniref:hypothetical protein n=1 Tax=Brevundimonas sp. SGAir0440 TaxID=2579977 RepID=UPI0010CD5403|nr:hypothetical protein [Brevundimonas sp. SGAir0440]QCQ99146.1 hypothetical protein E7T10_10910 [Brevundimonas sp. SGAir0440]
MERWIEEANDEGEMNFTAPLILIAALACFGPAAAQSQSEVPLYVGEVTAANAERFTSTLSNQVDKVVGLQIVFGTISEGDVLTDGSLNGGAYISFANSYAGGVQINIPDAYLRHGEWVADGFYTIKYGGMGQGIMGYYLRPADEAAIRLSEKPIVQRPVEALPPVERTRTAD